MCVCACTRALGRDGWCVRPTHTHFLICSHLATIEEKQQPHPCPQTHSHSHSPRQTPSHSAEETQTRQEGVGQHSHTDPPTRLTDTGSPRATGAQAGAPESWVPRACCRDRLRRKTQEALPEASESARGPFIFTGSGLSEALECLWHRGRWREGSQSSGSRSLITPSGRSVLSKKGLGRPSVVSGPRSREGPGQGGVGGLRGGLCAPLSCLWWLFLPGSGCRSRPEPWVTGSRASRGHLPVPARGEQRPWETQ